MFGKFLGWTHFKRTQGFLQHNCHPMIGLTLANYWFKFLEGVPIPKGCGFGNQRPGKRSRRLRFL